jgi:hypothetical protein
MALLLLSGAASAKPPAPTPSRDPNLTCQLKHIASDIASLRGLPPAILAALAASAGGMADRGEAFNAGDDVEEDIPPNRFIRAGRLGDHWFVWYEHGGIGYWQQIVIFDLARPGRPPRRVFDGRSPSPDLCAATDALLSRP